MPDPEAREPETSIKRLRPTVIATGPRPPRLGCSAVFYSFRKHGNVPYKGVKKTHHRVISNSFATSKPRLSDEPPLPETIALTELDLMCRACLDSWNELTQVVSTTGHLLSSQPEAQAWMRWALVDRLLVLINRSDWVLVPTRGRDSEESYEFRLLVAERVRTLTGGLTLSQDDVAEVRNVVEHSDEYLLGFVQSNSGKRLGAIVIAAGQESKLPADSVPIRYLGPFTGECVVYRRHVNLRVLVDGVRELKLALPAKKLTMDPRISYG